jgi:hypothetical protein
MPFLAAGRLPPLKHVRNVCWLPNWRAHYRELGLLQGNPSFITRFCSVAPPFWEASAIDPSSLAEAG